MAKSGSFIGTTSIAQSKFLPVVYWTTERNLFRGKWIVKVYVNYRSYDIYLDSIKSENVTISVTGGGTKNPATKSISDSNKDVHEGRWIDTQTFEIPFSTFTGTSITTNISLSINNIEDLEYDGAIVTSCSATGIVSLESKYSPGSPPSNIEISPINPKKGQTMTLSWSGAIAGVENPITGYIIERKISPNDWSFYKNVNSTYTNGSITFPLELNSNQTVQFRIRTKGTEEAGEAYYSDWSKPSQLISVDNSVPIMDSVYSNTDLVSYGGGDGGFASFSWSASDSDNENLRYQYRLSDDEEWSAYTTETSKNIIISGSQGSLVKLQVRANDYKVNSETLKSNSVRINKIPSTPIISFINSSGNEVVPEARPNFIIYKLKSTNYYSKKDLKFRVYLEVSNNSSMSNIIINRYMGEYSERVTLDLQSNSGISTYIGENQYYRIRARAYDGYDYSEDGYSGIRQKNSFPNYDSKLINIYEDPGIVRYDSVYWRLQDDRLRKGNIFNDNVILSWTMPDTEGKSNIKYIKIYRSTSDDLSSSDWKLILNRTVSNNTITTYKDSNIGVDVKKVRYKIIFEDEYGWTQQDSTSKVITLFRNTKPVFANSYIKLSKVSSSGAPVIRVYDNESIDVVWVKTTGDSDDGAILLTPPGSTTSSIMSGTSDKFKITLVFGNDPFISLQEGYPQDNSGNNITEKVLSENIRATTDDNVYNRCTLNFNSNIFDNFSLISKRQQYSNVMIQIESEDTFGEKSTNKLSIPIILDFRQKPILDDSLNYTIKDKTNNVEIAKLGDEITSEPNAYVLGSYYMINSGEQLEFKFPRAISPNAVTGDDGIYSYLIYYATSPSDTIINKDFKLLTEIPKSKLIVDGDYYIYNHTVSNYSINNFVKFAVSAKDNGYGKTEIERRENSLEGNKVEFPYSIMACRATTPNISLNELSFNTSSLEELSTVKVIFSINDLGGSKSRQSDGTEISSYWQYRNFERFSTGKFFKLSLLLSKTGDFSSNIDYDFDLEVQEEGNLKYPPEPGQKHLDEKSYAYPWSNYEIKTPFSNLVNTKNSYYAKLVLKFGHKKSSSETSEYLYAETPVVFLRSLRPTLSVRDKKIGINTVEPECSFHVSAGSDIEDQKNWVQFDSGSKKDQIIRFDLLTGHMTLGIIDCGRII